VVEDVRFEIQEALQQQEEELGDRASSAGDPDTNRKK
jgi:hypothetical protein